MLTSEKVREELRATERKAAEAWAKLDARRKEVAAAGVNLLLKEHEDTFNELDALGKEYDQHKSDAAEMSAKLVQLSQWDSNAQPFSLPPGDRGRMDEQRHRRLGDRITKSEQYDAMRRSGAFSSEAAFAAQVGRGFDRPIELFSRDEMEALLQLQRYGATTITGGGATSAGPFIQNDLIPGFVAYARKQPTLAAIVGQGTTDSDVVEYVTESAPTSGAAETAEDSAAAESTYAYATNTTNVREITHFVPITLRAMADAGQLRTIVEGRLAMDTLNRLDTQLYAGGGTGVDLTGVTVASGIGTFALGAYTRLDAVHRAITTVRVAAGVLADADYVIMHPNDWQKIRLEKDLNGQYLLGPANIDGARQVWGIPVIASTVATEGTITVGDFGGSSTMWLREGLSVTSGLDGNDFTKRRVSLLAAIRIAFAVTRAGGFCTVTSF